MKKLKKDNRGFMLVEVIVVTVVVATIMTSLFLVFNRLYNAYDKKSTYTSLDAIYALSMIKNYMMGIETVNSFMYNDLLEEVKNSTSGYKEISCSTMGNQDYKNFCNIVFEEYNINKMYIVDNSLNSTSLEKIKNTENINQTFKDYLDYLLNIGINKDSFLEKGYYSELLITETYSEVDVINKNVNNKYAYLPTTIVK